MSKSIDIEDSLTDDEKNLLDIVLTGGSGDKVISLSTSTDNENKKLIDSPKSKKDDTIGLISLTVDQKEKSTDPITEADNSKKSKNKSEKRKSEKKKSRSEKNKSEIKSEYKSNPVKTEEKSIYDPAENINHKDESEYLKVQTTDSNGSLLSSNDKSSNKDKCSDGGHKDNDDLFDLFVKVLVLAIIITIIFMILCYPTLDMWLTLYVHDSTYRWLCKSIIFFILLVIVLMIAVTLVC